MKVGSISIEADFKVSLRGMKIVWITQRYLAKLEIIINDDEED